MGVIQEMVTLSSGMVWNIVLFKVAQSRPKYPLANHCADSTTCREAGNDMNERTYSISDLKPGEINSLDLANQPKRS